MFIMQQMTNIQTIHNRLKWKALQTDIPIVLMLKLKRMHFYIPITINYTTFYLTYFVCPSPKIFPDLDEILPLGVVFCVDHESDNIFSIRDRDQG